MGAGGGRKEDSVALNRFGAATAVNKASPRGEPIPGCRFLAAREQWFRMREFLQPVRDSRN